MPINSRNKGSRGEIELFRLLSDELGYIVKRRLDAPREGGADSLDVPGWSIECKRYARATRADIRGWWEQAVRQAHTEKREPVLFYRADRDEWRSVVSAMTGQYGYEATMEISMPMWCWIAREYLAEANKIMEAK
jgi:hypothetical protein